MVPCGFPLCAVFSQIIFPVFQSRQRTRYWWLPGGILPTTSAMYSPLRGGLVFWSLTTAVRKILSPQTIGDDQPRPGMPVFQATFLVVSQVSGRLEPLATAPCAPRNCGQLSSACARGSAATRKKKGIQPMRRMWSILCLRRSGEKCKHYHREEEGGWPWRVAIANCKLQIANCKLRNGLD